MLLCLCAGAANDLNYGSVAMTAGQHAQHYVLDLRPMKQSTAIVKSYLLHLHHPAVKVMQCACEC